MNRRPPVRRTRNGQASAGPRPQRLHKLLAQAGLAARRQAEVWIAAGRVTVNGQVATVGTCVTGTERITVDGQPVRLAPARPQAPRLPLYHKPEGEVCTRVDPQGRPTVFENLPRLRGARWVGVGRLDVNTSGLLLFTDDGALADHLMHPRGGFEREYAVRVRGPVSPEVIERLRAGVMLHDGPARSLALESAGGSGHNHWYRQVVTEGRQRIVRRMWEAVGCEVSRLIRVRFGPLELPRDLPRGRSRPATPAETRALGLTDTTPATGGSGRRENEAPPRRLERDRRRG